jgi:hypothetical protein
MNIHTTGNHHMSLHFLAALVSVALLVVIYSCIVSASR